ncbi:MAG: hypothetical protein QOH31_4502, partial [Verrucomicrobiota bacterium]
MRRREERSTKPGDHSFEDGFRIVHAYGGNLSIVSGGGSGKRTCPVLHCVLKPSVNPETGAYPQAQLLAAKVSNPRFRAKVRKFPRHFKGHFS